MGTVTFGRFPFVDSESGFPEWINAPSVDTNFAGIVGDLVCYASGEPDTAVGGLILQRGSWTAIYLREDDMLLFDGAQAHIRDLPDMLEMIKRTLLGLDCVGHYMGQRFSLRRE